VCPMCQHSFDPSELDPNVVLPNAPLKPQTSKDDDDDEEIEDAVEVDEDDIDEEEQAAKELELDGDDAAIISGGAGDDDGETPDFDGYSTDEDEDQDAALVADDEDTLPPGTDDDGDEEIEIFKMSNFETQIEKSKAEVAEAQNKIAELSARIDTARMKMSKGTDISLDIENASLDDVHAHSV